MGARHAVVAAVLSEHSCAWCGGLVPRVTHELGTDLVCCSRPTCRLAAAVVAADRAALALRWRRRGRGEVAA